MKINTKKDRRQRVALRQRKRIAGTAERPRLRVFRSVSHIYAQVIDDMSGKTLASASSTEPTFKAQLSGAAKPGNKAGAQALGEPEDQVFMHMRGFLDLDGHQWSFFHMDMSAIPEP